MTDVSKLRGYIEVSAESEYDLGNKLYGPDDTVAQCWLVGVDYREFADRHEDPDEMYAELQRRMHREEYTMSDVYDLQDEYETVNDLLRDAVINGHGVLFKTHGMNLGYPSDYTEIPHFGHGASNCQKPYDDCWDAPSAGNVYRMHDIGDLIVRGRFDTDSMGRYKLRDDVHLVVCGVSRDPSEGTTDAQRVASR